MFGFKEDGEKTVKTKRRKKNKCKFSDHITMRSLCDDISRLRWTIWEPKNAQQVLKLGELMNHPRGRLAAIKRNNLRPSVRVGCTIWQKLAGNAAVFCRCQFLSRKLFCDGQDLIQISGSVKLYSILPFIWHLAV